MASAAEQAYELIRDQILDGTLAQGFHLKEEVLAKAANASRTPVREAMRRLHAEGLVEFVPNRGAFVADWYGSDIDVIFRLRAALEPLAAELAAQRITKEQLEELHVLQNTMEAAIEGRAPGFLELVARANNQFHTLIREAAHSNHLIKVMALIVERPVVLGTFMRYDDEELGRSMAHHREILSALRARDGAWVASTMRTHILAAHHAFVTTRQERAGAPALSLAVVQGGESARSD